MYTVRRARVIFASLGLAVALSLTATPPAAAGPVDAPRAAWVASSPLRVFTDWLVGLWAAAGCTFDPSGGCGSGATVPPPTGTEGNDAAGCTLDPDGGCVTGGTTPPLEGDAAGCTMDPSGGGACHG